MSTDQMNPIVRSKFEHALIKTIHAFDGDPEKIASVVPITPYAARMVVAIREHLEPLVQWLDKTAEDWSDAAQIDASRLEDAEAKLAKAMELFADIISSLECEGIEVDEYQERVKEISDGTQTKGPVQDQALQGGHGQAPRDGEGR